MIDQKRVKYKCLKNNEERVLSEDVGQDGLAVGHEDKMACPASTACPAR